MIPLRARVNDVGSVFLVLCTMVDTLETMLHAFERSHHVHIVFGVSRGTALGALGVVTAVQMAAQIALLFNRFFFAIGAILPSTTLAALVWAQAFVLGELSDSAVLVWCAAVSAGAAVIALFRYDRQARASLEQVPVDQRLFLFETKINEICSRLRTGLVLTPTSVALFFYAIVVHPFWSTTSAAHEYHQARFRACMALSAVSLLIGAQDVASFVFLRDRFSQWSEECGVDGIRLVLFRLWARLRGGPRRGGILEGMREGKKKKLY
tara:strand:+ start:463 stop:1260 length:798 start_codon:yes stop_codon:yes gene_type:complete